MSDKMREDFEVWHGRMIAQRVINARTIQAFTLEVNKEAMFEIWRASRESLVIELPDSARMYFNGAPVEAYTDGVKCWHGGVDAARLAIKAAGLKVTP